MSLPGKCLVVVIGCALWASADAQGIALANPAALVADTFAGADLGAKINAAMAACPAQPGGCTILVQQGGLISTPPKLAAGTTLTLSPTGIYTLATTWSISHRGITVNFSNAQIQYARNDGSAAIYLGKGIASKVDIAAAGAVARVSWVSGDQFLAVDVGDQLQWYVAGSLQAANVAKVESPTSLLLTGPADAAQGVPATFYLLPDLAMGSFAGRGVVLNDLNIVGSGRADSSVGTALRVELTSGAIVRGLTVSNLVAGTCLDLRGALSNDFYDVRCYTDGSGMSLDVNSKGGFEVTGSNANRFFGMDITASSNPAGSVLMLEHNSSLNMFLGLHVEGNNNRSPALIQDSVSNSINLVDWERNGPSEQADIQIIRSPQTVIYGPAQFQSFTSRTAIAAQGSRGLRLHDLTIAGGYTTALRLDRTSTGSLMNIGHSEAAAVDAPGFLLLDEQGSLSVPGMLQAGTIRSGSPLERYATTPPLGGAALQPGCTDESMVDVSGAAVGMSCVMSGAGGTQPGNVQPQCYVGAAGKVVPQLCTAVSVTPKRQTYNIRVIQ